MKERKTFTFDGENSADYGLYISGDSVYNAPNREIDMVSIPGRNGQLAIDMGRYENITVTYPAFVFADTQEEFREKIRRIRNWLCSKTSYQRLTDEYNPESFRLGLYKSGLEVEPIFYNRCGEFEMSFDCKPQRFLFTGEEVFTLGEWGETETYSGSIVSFEGTETTAIKTLNASIVPKQSGSGDPSPSNVRPISGYSEVNVNVCGVNVWDEEWELGRFNTSTGANASSSNQIRSKNYIPIKPDTRYYFKTPYNAWVIFFNENRESIANGQPSNFQKDGKSFACGGYGDIYLDRFTTPSEARYMRFYLVSNYGTTYNNDISINYPSTDHEYHAYNGTSYPISLGQTVYGGTLDVLSGVLTINKGMVSLGSLTWAKETNGNRFSASIPNTFKQISGGVVINAICSMYKVSSRDFVLSTNNAFSVHYSAGANYLNIHDDNAYSTMTAEQFKTYLNGQTLVCELQTPITVQLTANQVTTLLGNNNIFADSGDVTVEIGENPYILVNPTKFEATPIFEVEGSGTLSVGDTTLTINNDGTTIIDTEMMEAYEDDNGAIISRNDDVEGGFPTLTSGINNVEADGLTSVKITPKFWEL